MIRFLALFFSLCLLAIGSYFRTKSQILPGNRIIQSPPGDHPAESVPSREPHDELSAPGGKNFILPVDPLYFAAAGWILFGCYWALHYQEYRDANDLVNALFSILAIPFFAFIALKEIESIPFGGLEGLRFLSGITIISMAGYTLVSEIPLIELYLEYLNAYVVSAFLTFSGFPSEAGEIDFSGNPLWYRSNDLILSVPIQHNGHDEILITLSCTAFSSMFLFGAAIFTSRESWSVKWKAFLLIIPAIFVFNIIRMAMITYLTYTGATSAEFAHHILGKIGSLMVLLFLAWVLFTFLPSVLDSISQVFDVIFGKKSKTHGNTDQPVMQKIK